MIPFPKFKPMKPTEAPLESLRWPMYTTPKYDGIRFVSLYQGLLSNSLKPLPNQFLQGLSQKVTVGFDGEILITFNGRPLPLNEIHSWVMSRSKTLDDLHKDAQINLIVFDWMLEPTWPYEDRLHVLRRYLRTSWATQDPRQQIHPRVFVSLAPNFLIYTPEMALEYNLQYLRMGLEGSVLRDPKGHYKFGRSTVKEQLGIKIKPFADTEGIIVGFEPRQENLSESKLNERGLKEKSKRLEFMRDLPEVGVMVLDSPEFSNPVRIGTGFDRDLAKQMWTDQDSYIGKRVKFRYLPPYTKDPGSAYTDSPRHPSFVSFRSDLDMTDF